MSRTVSRADVERMIAEGVITAAVGYAALEGDVDAVGIVLGALAVPAVDWILPDVVDTLDNIFG